MTDYIILRSPSALREFLWTTTFFRFFFFCKRPLPNSVSDSPSTEFLRTTSSVVYINVNYINEDEFEINIFMIASFLSAPRYKEPSVSIFTTQIRKIKKFAVGSRQGLIWRRHGGVGFEEEEEEDHKKRIKFYCSK